MPAALTYLALGLAWTGGSLLFVVAKPDYWNAATTIDYLAVWSYSLALLLAAAAIPLLARDAVATLFVRRIGWVAAAGALVAGVANLLEDGVGLESWGTVYVIGSLTFYLGLLLFGAALWGEGRRRYALVASLWIVGAAMTLQGFGFFVLVGSILAIDARGRAVAAA